MESVKFIFAITNGLIFIIVATFHYYWSFGGTYGANVVLPEIESNGKKIFVPGKLITFIVASLFLSLGLYFIIGLKYDWFYKKPTTYILYAIITITFIRTIGDFKYVGFFKKKSSSIFATYDTKYYSPLSLFISILSFIILILLTEA